MLFETAVSPPALVLLKTLMKFKEFEELRLVGGTALALQIGHRISVDLDLFGVINFDNIPVERLFSKFSKQQTLSRSKYINSFYLENIKVDFVNYYYPWIDDPYIENGIRFASLRDIAAMKLAAITNRGSKKDFIDLYFLLKKFSLQQMMEFYQMKYPDGSLYMVIKSLSWFGDAENEFSIEMIKNVSWETVKDSIQNEVINYQSNN